MDQSLYKNTNVKELSNKDFASNGKILLNKDGFLMAYAPWCGHCVRRVPMWTELATKLKNINFVICSLNCMDENNKNLVKMLEVTMFPTVFYFSKDGNLTKYTEEIEEATILNYACNKLENL